MVETRAGLQSLLAEISMNANGLDGIAERAVGWTSLKPVVATERPVLVPCRCALLDGLPRPKPPRPPWQAGTHRCQAARDPGGPLSQHDARGQRQPLHPRPQPPHAALSSPSSSTYPGPEQAFRPRGAATLPPLALENEAPQPGAVVDSDTEEAAEEQVVNYNELSVFQIVSQRTRWLALFCGGLIGTAFGACMPGVHLLSPTLAGFDFVPCGT